MLVVVDWFVASQVFLTFGLVGLLVAAVLTTLYMCVHQISKNATLISLVIFCFGAGKYALVLLQDFVYNWHNYAHYALACLIASGILY